MKKALFVFFILLIAGFILWRYVFSDLGGPEPQAIIVIDKAFSSSKHEQWIVAYNPEKDSKKDKFKIYVDDISTWNLIEIENPVYMALFSKEQGKWHLDWIGISGKRQIPQE